MTAASSPANADRSLLDAAVHQSRTLSVSGLLERAFTYAFRDLVYSQIWEDPEVDMEALDIRPDSRIVAIASGGCNLLSYLKADPARVHGVDRGGPGRLNKKSALLRRASAGFRPRGAALG
jgi:S-adenosylmethionine-diacylglycerol 3-amino-3-carboxypropyl transferase